MIVDCDAAQLEWRVAAELSRDPVMIEEIRNKIDIHTSNAIKFFGDSMYRQDAKTFAFRMIYGGTAYAFYADQRMPDFPLSQWEQIVADFFAKYSTLKQWQDDNFQLVLQQGYLQTFTGRIYRFEQVKQPDGGVLFSRPDVCNYPVQGTSTADLIPLVMSQTLREIHRRNLQDKILFINQVHDSLVFDIQPDQLDTIAKITTYYFRNLPITIRNYWGYEWITPMDGEVKYGENWGNLVKYKL